MTLDTILGRVAAGIILSSVALGTGAQADTFTLGAQVPLTGNLARVGTGMHEGITVAIDMANRELAGRHEFKLATIDDESNPAKAVAAVEKLASQGVVALTGGYGSNIIGPASEAAAKSNLVYITSGGVAPELTERGLDTFFRINNSDGYGKAMLGLLKEMGVAKVSIIYSNKEATDEMAHFVQKGLIDAGVEVATHEFDASTTDFKSIVNKVKLRDRSEAIAMIGYENDYVGILRAASVLKPEAKAVVGVWSLATSQMNQEFHDLMQNVYGTSLLPYPVSFSGDEAVAFSETYKTLHGKEPDYLGQFGYVQTRLLIDAVVAAAEKGETNGKAVAQALRAIQADTLIGEVTFNEKGDNPNFAHRMGQHQGDRVEIVWPAEAATADKRFPAVPW
ncbi:ABC transporter substrate-binding protein [Caenispirillum bisanense]|uniref:ABC transporter substrate-binding protein n=1 Tax=Caenispirillum bisanense TaxID=414052 RepID=UPI0031DEF541